MHNPIVAIARIDSPSDMLYRYPADSIYTRQRGETVDYIASMMIGAYSGIMLYRESVRDTVTVLSHGVMIVCKDNIVREKLITRILEGEK